MRSMLSIAVVLGCLGGAGITAVATVVAGLLGLPGWLAAGVGLTAGATAALFAMTFAMVVPLPAPAEPAAPAPPPPAPPDPAPLARAIEALARPGAAPELPDGLAEPLALALKRSAAVLAAERKAAAVREAGLRQAPPVAPLEPAVDALQRELVALEARSREALAVRDAFLARMSHELRTPLNAILGYVELLLEEVQGEAADDAARIRGAALQLLALVTTLLDLTQIQSGAYDVVPEPVQLADLVARVVDSVRAEALARGNTLAVEVPPGLVATLDRRMVQSILYNLASNGAKYTEGGRVSISAEQVGDRLRLVVADTGIGLTERQIREAFAPFRQADESSTRRYDGAGLGLAVVRGFAEAMGGTVGIVSQPGQGATVTVELPVVVMARAGALGPTEDEPTLLLR